jgi:hypothetical protein
MIGLKKIVVFSIRAGTSTRSESYFVDLIYPWVGALSTLGIPTSGDLPRRFSLRGILSELGLFLPAVLVFFAFAVAMLATRDRVVMVVSFAIWAIAVVIYSSAHYLVRRYDRE